MAVILNIETSTDVCSVCVARDGVVLAIKETERSYSHSETIALFIKEIVDEAGVGMKGLDAVSISNGPGSYTALRIGAATAKGICFSLNIPLISIGTLEALAHSLKDTVEEKDIIIPMIDARRKEVYHSVYDASMKEILKVEPFILDEHSYKLYDPYNRIHFCGDGVAKTKDIIQQVNAKFHEIECSSKHMILLSEKKYTNKIFEDIAYYEPLYYKSPNITVQKKNILR